MVSPPGRSRCLVGLDGIVVLGKTRRSNVIGDSSPSQWEGSLG